MDVLGADIGAALRGRRDALEALAAWLRKRDAARNPVPYALARQLGLPPPPSASVTIPTTLVDLALPHPADAAFHLPLGKLASLPLLALISRPRLEKVLFKGFEEAARSVPHRTLALSRGWGERLARQIRRMEDLPGLLPYIRDVKVRAPREKWPEAFGAWLPGERVGEIYPSAIKGAVSNPLQWYVRTVAHELGPGGHAGMHFALDQGILPHWLHYELGPATRQMYRWAEDMGEEWWKVYPHVPQERAAKAYEVWALRPRSLAPTKELVKRVFREVRKGYPALKRFKPPKR